MHVHERRDSAPSGYAQDGPAPENHMLNLRLALTPRDFKSLEDKLYAVSTPGSPDYGKHLSKEQVEELVAPSFDGLSAVKSWLVSHGLTTEAITPAGDWLRLNVTVKQANELLDTQYMTFTHESTGLQTVRTLEYSVPADMKSHISFLHPTVAYFIHRFPVEPVGGLLLVSEPQKLPSTPVAPPACSKEFTPACAQSRYGIPTTLANDTSNRIAVSAFGDQYASASDLQAPCTEQKFLEAFRPDLPSNTTFSIELIDGGKNNQRMPGDEADLDVQYTIGIASGVPVEFISVGDDNSDGIDGYMDIIARLLNEDTIPNVLTTSYSFNERYLPFSIANTLCNAYAQIGARGTSLFFSSGDGGVAGSSRNSACTRFVPTFPSTCPFVTSVGGTTFTPEEIAADFSGGGFSSFFATPSYQASAVSAYISSIGGEYHGLYNASGRAFPDISAASTQCTHVYGGNVVQGNGTSCSTPLIASMVGLVNDELTSAGKAPLGFLNPLIYANQDSFTDITEVGSNPGCHTNGFSATTGWDPVTGVGSPVYSKLRTLAGLRL
ncbi:family S53 protease-like protein [Dentipellis sp. KUC8613]|nr:family S53 protease-like protein [Dentipellis sp. KUC8613]